MPQRVIQQPIYYPFCRSSKCDICDGELEAEQSICSINRNGVTIQSIFENSRHFTPDGDNVCCKSCRTIPESLATVFHSDCLAQISDFVKDRKQLDKLVQRLEKNRSSKEQSSVDTIAAWRDIQSRLHGDHILKNIFLKLPEELIVMVAEAADGILLADPKVLEAMTDRKWTVQVLRYLGKHGLSH
jgi:hypothetical protein